METTLQVSNETTAMDLFVQAGLVPSADSVPAHLQLFIEQADQVLGKVRKMIADGELEEPRCAEFQQLILDVCARVLFHPIVASNNYLERFSHGVTTAQASHECKQFSVFALQFDVAQAKLVANSPTMEAYEERLQVLLNEKGIPFKDGFEGELSGEWKDATVHFTWMLNMARGLGMDFEDIGKIWIAHEGTKAFVQATFEKYASTDANLASGAAFAIENWAANSLWKPWIAGMEKLNESMDKPVNLGYLKYHNLEEQHHSQATLDELLESFTEPWFDCEKFLQGAESMLTEGVQHYYEAQLETLPEKDNTWPQFACDKATVDWKKLPRIAVKAVSA